MGLGVAPRITGDEGGITGANGRMISGDAPHWSPELAAGRRRPTATAGGTLGAAAIERWMAARPP